MSSPLPFTEGFCRGLALGLAVLVALLAGSAHAEPAERLRWSRVAIAEDVAVTIHVVSANELAGMQGSKRRDMRDVRQSHRHGFAKLYRNTATGAWACHVYFASKPTAPMLAHEHLHCAGWVHP